MEEREGRDSKRQDDSVVMKSKILFFNYSYVHTMFRSFLPPSPNPLPTTPSIPSRNYSALISNFVEERV
jgi:hypothetical protein